jgi:peptidoglycan/LPS O-acetylase OafA/YrhL
MVGLLYVFDAHPVPGVRDSSGVVDVLFVPLVMTLAIGIGSLPGVLSTRLMVYGGQISFSLYMVHELVHTSWEWTAAEYDVTLGGDEGKLVVAGLLAIAVAGAMALFHLVEEPTRHWMRRMVDVRDAKATQPVDATAEPATGKLQSIDGALESRPKAVSA